jgi:hypothetical protein
MARLFVTSINLNKNELQNARIQNLSSAPSSPVAGQVYFDTTTNVMYFYNGTTWVSTSGSAEVIQDTVDAMLIAGTGITKTYDDPAGTLTVAIDSTVTTNSGTQTLTNKTITSPTVSGLTLSDATISFEGSTPNAYQTFLTVTDPTQDRTITLKDATGTLAFTSDIPTSTDGLSEGTTNLYYTAERVQDEINNTIVAGIGLDKTYNDPAGTYTLDIDATVATLSGTQTLTNKTLGSGNALGANLDAGSYKITNLGTPTASGDAVNKSYVDGLTSGLDWKTSVNVLAASNVPLTGSTPLSVDSHTLSNGYRVLLKNQTTGSENGIYDLTITGGSYALTRSSDADAYGELIGAAVFVMEGTTYAATSWVQSNHYITDFSNQTWTQFSGAGTYLAGSGLQITGNTFSVDTTPTSGSASIRTDNGATEVKVDTTRGLSVDSNGLGINAGTGITFSAGALTLASGYGIRKFSENIASTTSHVATHNLGTRDIHVAVYDNNSPYAEVFPDIEHTTTNTVTVKFATAPTADQYRVVIIG